MSDHDMKDHEEQEMNFQNIHPRARRLTAYNRTRIASFVSKEDFRNPSNDDLTEMSDMLPVTPTYLGDKYRGKSFGRPGLPIMKNTRASNFGTTNNRQ